MTEPSYKVLPSDVAVLRELAERVREACDSARNVECRRLWRLHDLCQGERPLILTETDGGIEMVLGDLHLRCREEWARGQERGLLNRLMHFDIIRDDFPLEPYVGVSWNITIGDYGVPFAATQPQTDGTRGAYHIDPPISDLERQFECLRPRPMAVDRAGTLEFKALLASWRSPRRGGKPSEAFGRNADKIPEFACPAPPACYDRYVLRSPPGWSGGAGCWTCRVREAAL